MRTIKLFAGLGNQLFQYAYGVFLRRQGERVRFLIDPEPGCIVDVFDMDFEGISALRGGLGGALRKAWAKYVLGSYELGFFQEARFAQALKESRPLAFRNAPSYQGSSWFKLASSADAVSLHVRGGDILAGANTFGAVCTREYYAAATRAVRTTLGDPLFLVFTNDEGHARDMLDKVPGNFQVVRDQDFLDDPGFHLYLMTRCRHHIIANSTYSWWGAYLSPAVDGVKIAPDRWTIDGSIELEPQFFKGWTRMPSAQGAAPEPTPKKDT